MPKDCVVIFGRELTEAEAELMRVNTGSESFQCREWEPPHIAKALLLFCKMKLPNPIYFYDAIDYHSTVFLSLCEPVPIFIYREEADTEEILGKSLDCFDRYEEIFHPLDRMSYPFRVHYKDLASLGIVPKDSQCVHYVDTMKAAFKEDLRAVRDNCVEHIKSIKIFTNDKPESS